MKAHKPTQTLLTSAAVALASVLPANADPITVPNAGFEERENYDAFPEGTDKYHEYNQETWRHFDLANNGGPLRIWNPGIPGTDETGQGIADVAFGGNAPEGKYVVVVRSRQNDPARTFEAATQLLEETFDSTLAYTLTAKVGRLPNGEAEGGSSNYTPDWFGYSLQFVVGGTNIDGAQYAGQVTGGTILAEDHNSLPVPVNDFITSTVIYRPNPADSKYDGQPIQIRLAALETPENPEDDSLAGWVVFDDVTLETGAAPPARFEITKIDYSPADEMVTLTWDSRPGETYAVKVSTDLSNWDADLDDGIDASDGETTTETFDITGQASESGELFFRIERQ